jgi:hypothetical protein
VYDCEPESVKVGVTGRSRRAWSCRRGCQPRRKDEVLSEESTDHAFQEMSERHDCGQTHGENLIETGRIEFVSKSFIYEYTGF